VGCRPIIFHHPHKKHFGQAVAAQGGHGNFFALRGEADTAIRLMHQISILIQAFHHGGNRLRRRLDVGTQKRKRHLVMVLLQAIDLGGVASHGGTDSHDAFSNSRNYQPG
jgi:hypothetical protein